MDKIQDLSGQVALVTGASSGLGQAYAVALARAGACVVITAREESRLNETAEMIRQQKGTVLPIPADVTDPQAVSGLVGEVEQSAGPIRLLVNTAGIFQAFGQVAVVDPQAWWREIEVNLKGPFLLSHAVLPGMIENGGGRIINIASGAGIYSLETISAYCVSKAALIRLTDILALETGPHGVHVFAVDPGTVRTPMNDLVMASEIAKKRAPQVVEWFENLYAKGLDTPIEKSVQLIMKIASGQVDGLSGCFLTANDDIDSLIARVPEIREKDLLRLRLNGQA